MVSDCLSDLLIWTFATVIRKLWCNLFNQDRLYIHVAFQTPYQSQQTHDMLKYMPVKGLGYSLVLLINHVI